MHATIEDVGGIKRGTCRNLNLR